MGSNFNRLIQMVSSMIIFCIGIVVIISDTRAYSLALDLTREKIKEDVIYQQVNTIDRETITYAELIAGLLQPLEYDIMVDDLIIHKNIHNKEMISDYNIKDNSYTKSYQYNSEGDIEMIIYASDK